MKVLVLFIMMLIPQVSQAGYPINFDQTRAWYYYTNSTPFVSVCHGYIYAQTIDGYIRELYFAFEIPPFSNTMKYVITDATRPFIAAQSDIYCQHRY